jgi:hypothetical protein
MNFETILEIIQPRPPFWLRVWLFFFLLINRKEGKRLAETFIEKAAESIQMSTEAIQKYGEMMREMNAYAAEAKKKLAETRERARAAGY